MQTEFTLAQWHAEATALGATVNLPALTLHDPWARLCAAGLKTIETRLGPALSGFRGPLVIHRGKAPNQDPDGDYLASFGFPACPPVPDGWPADIAGHCIGVVFVDRTTRHIGSDGLLALGFEREARDMMQAACFHDLDRRYLSHLTRAAWLTRPIPARGTQGRWRVEIPHDSLPAWAGGLL